MNVTFLAEKLDRTGGSGVSLDLMARELSDRNHSVRILTTNIFHENDVPDDTRYDVVSRVTESSSRYDGFLKIKQVLDQYEAGTDVYHVFNPQYLSMAGLYRKNGNVPTVGRLNSYSAFCTNPGRMTGKCYKNCSLADKIRHDDREPAQKVARAPQYAYQHVAPRFMNHLDRLFALSPGVKQVYVHNHVNRDLIDVVPNFYDPTFTTQSETEYDILSDEFTILYVGRLRAAKGVDLLVDAARQLDMSNIAINIVGGGPMCEELGAKTERHNLGASIRFHGWIDQPHLPKYYEQSDVFVHPGRWPEPFGRTILEALQHDCPPIVSNIGAPPWIIGEAGEKFKTEDSMDLTNEIKKMQTASELFSHTNKCSSRLERFDPKYIVPAIESRYQID